MYVKYSMFGSYSVSRVTIKGDISILLAKNDVLFSTNPIDANVLLLFEWKLVRIENKALFFWLMSHPATRTRVTKSNVRVASCLTFSTIWATFQRARIESIKQCQAVFL